MPPMRGCIGLDDVGGLGVDESDVFGDAREHLAGGDRGVQRPGELGVPVGVIGIQRFLDPDQVEALEQPANPLRRGPVPLLIGIDHEWNVIAQVFPYPLEPGDVGFPVGLPTLILMPPMPLDRAWVEFSMTWSMGACRKPP